MKSFKKIALAMVAAMTLGTISVAPANATVMTVALTVNGSAPATAGTTSATAIALPVPSDNEVEAPDALRIVATVETGTAVTVEAANASVVSALHTNAAPVTASSGSSSLTIATGTGNQATFFVYTRTTAVGTVVVRNGGTTLTYFVQGTAGLINTLSVSAPANGAAGTKQDILVTATDVFGNKVADKSITATVFGGTATLDSATALTGKSLTDFGVATFKATLPTTGTRALVMFALTTAGDGESANVSGLAVRSLTPFAEIAVRDLATELATANAALAAERTGRAADKAAADKALADALAKAASDSATAKLAADTAAVKAAADLATANSEIAKLKAEAVTAKAAADKALADAIAKANADAVTAKAASDKAISDLRRAFNKLARQWNKKNPTARVALIK